MPGQCDIQIFLADGVTPSLRLLSPRVEGLRFSSQVHGGYRDCSFKIPDIPIQADYPELPYRGVVKVYSRGNTLCWQGRIEDRYGVRSGGLEYVEVTAIGDYDRMNDQVYNRIWVDRRLSRWWFPDSTISSAAYNGKHRSDMFVSFKSELGIAADATPLDVLGLAAIDGRKYPEAWYALWKYEMPSGELVKRITFNYRTLFPRGSWRFGLFGQAGAAVEGTPIFATGSGSQDITLVTPSQQVWIFLQAWSPFPDLTGGLSWIHTDAGYTYTGANWAVDATYDMAKTGSIKTNTGANATDYMELTFTGRGIQLFGGLKNSSGIVKIYRKRGAGAYALQATVDTSSYGQGFGDAEQLCNSFYDSQILDWDTYTIKIEMTNTKHASASNYYLYFDYALVNTAIFAQASAVVVYGETGTIYSDTIIKSMATAVCPDISADQSNIGSPAVSITDATFETEMRPTQVSERLALLGDGSYNLWDLAVWQDSKLYFAVRPTAHTHRVELDHCQELRIGGSMRGVWNKVAAAYQNDHGTLVHPTASEDTTSQALYGIREFNIPMGNTDTATAAQRQAVALAAWKDPTGTSRIVIDGGLQTALGVDIPLEELRAGRILLISGLIPHVGIAGKTDNRTVFFCKAVEYDADNDSLIVTPGDPSDTVEAELLRIGG